MQVWAGFWNILNGGQFLLGDSINEDGAIAYATLYSKKYPNSTFEVVQVDFAHPRWYREELKNDLDQNVWETFI
jgi:hypothetical protein